MGYSIRLANLSDQITPVVVIAAAVFWAKAREGKELTVVETFTSLSIIALVSGPLTNIMAAYPSFKASIGCFDRIQEYLQSEEAIDYRTYDSPSSESGKECSSLGDEDLLAKGFELQNVKLTTKGTTAEMGESRPAVIIENSSFGKDSEGIPIVKDINVSFLLSKLSVVAGPVGCGKTIFFKALLGEMPISTGSIRVMEGLAGSTAYCDQQPWLRNASVKDNIIGHQEFDALYYEKVIHACALDRDLAQLPQGQETIIGSGGITLSAGQKQRVVSLCLHPSAVPVANIIT